MAYKRAFDELFIEGTVRRVAEVGIENTRTKDVAEYAGFSEATMFRRFPTKDILLRETFLCIDKKVSSILTQNVNILDPANASFEFAVYTIWRKVFRHLIENRSETLFLIRYRYSSLYTEEVRSKRQAYNGGFDRAYEIFEKYYGTSDHSYRGFLINYIFEMTLCFAEKIITGRIEDSRETEQDIWLAVSSAVMALTAKKTTRFGTGPGAFGAEPQTVRSAAYTSGGDIGGRGADN